MEVDLDQLFEGAIAWLRTGVQARVTERLPLRMIITDRRITLVPLMSAAEGGGALLIHPSGLLDALQTLFDLTWQSARRLVVSAEGADGPCPV